MFLNNFYKFLACSKLIDSGTNTVQTILNVTGASYTLDASNSGYATISDAMHNMLKSSTGSTYGVVFGNGTDSVTAGDYKLSGSYISTYTGTYTSSFSSDDDGVTYTTLYTLTNTSTTTSMTISEVGLIWPMNYHNNTTNSYVTQCLVERTLLDEPITIAPNGVGQVTYTIRINYPVL